MHPTYISTIDSLTAETLQNALRKCLATNPTFVANGGDVLHLQTMGDIQNALRYCRPSHNFFLN